MGDDPTEEITQALGKALGFAVQVTELHPLTGGASRQSWRFEASPLGGGGESRSYVLQREMLSGQSSAVPMTTQARVLRAAEDAGVPVPHVVASGADGGRQYVIAGWLGGEALPQKMLRDPAFASGRAHLMEDCAKALVAIHGISPDGLGLVEQDRLGSLRAALDSIAEPRPVLELGYRWLVDNRPRPRPPVVVHGDFRLGNLLVGSDGLMAVLDWEIAHLGDPHEDVAWPTIRAWRFDRYRTAGTFPEPDAWLQAYNSVAGPAGELDPNDFRWWQVAGTWSWAVISAMQARRHLDGWVQSMEHAVIGRRVCESEWDLLELLP